MFAFTQRPIYELKTIHKKTDDDRIYSSVEYFFIIILVAGSWKYPEKSHIMLVELAKNQPRKNKWGFINVPHAKKWSKSF